MATFNSQIEPVWTFPGRIIADTLGVMSPITDSLSTLTSPNTSFTNFFGGSVASNGSFLSLNYAGPGIISLIRANGTRLSSSTILNTDTVGRVAFGGYTGIAFSGANSNSAQINAIATENWSATATGSLLEFRTTPNTTVSSNPVMTLGNNGTTYVGKFTSTPLGTSLLSAVDTTDKTFVLQAKTSQGTNGAVLACDNAGNDGTNYLCTFYHNGSLLGSITHNAIATTAYNTSSDYRLKENIVPIVDAISIIKQIKPSSFNFKQDVKKQAVTGFIAHELQEILPEAVIGFKNQTDKQGNPVMQAVDYSKLTPILTKAIQELTQRIEVLENK